MRVIKLILAVALVASPAFAAADLDMRNQAFYLLDVSTSAAKTVVLPGQSVLIKHTGDKTDGTASGASDYITVQWSTDTTDASKTAGRKLNIKQGEAYRIPAVNIPNGADGSPHMIQIKAVTGSAKVQIAVGG